MVTTTEIPARHVEMLSRIKAADDDLTERFREKMRVNGDLDRTLVSFQANKTEVGHRWCKYREGFSAELIRYLLEKTGLTGGTILDPFAGSGTALFVAAERGLNAVGIELLPSTAEIIAVRDTVLHADKETVGKGIRAMAAERAWMESGNELAFPHLRITAGAFPSENERQLGRFLFEAARTTDKLLSRLLRFAALSVLEEISFTRKDGQYLRWDQRSGRCLGKKLFDKGRIYSFDEAILRKLNQIADDIEGREDEPVLFERQPIAALGNIDIRIGSCLDIVPKMPPESLDGVITSPPYCNRYDYTRTYALELAMLDVGEEGIRRLRQSMLSCTVENKDKHDLAEKFGHDAFQAALEAFEGQRVLSLVLEYLNDCKDDGSINNPGIVRMVRNYFFESALLIFASAATLRPGAPFVMVNDNVRYQGAHVPVDLILSEFAEQAGFDVEAIWMLPKGKGNSSQQMGRHGRQEIRKCVYIWRKDK